MHNKKEVIKASAAVQVQNKMTLLQRRAWNILLAHAYDELGAIPCFRPRCETRGELELKAQRS
jgi:hypothetical protein